MSSPTRLGLYEVWHKHATQRPRKLKQAKPSKGFGHGHTCLVQVRDDLPNGRGLAVTQDVKAGQPILTLPSSFLFNVRTIAKYFESSVAAQILPSPLRREQPTETLADSDDAVKLPLTSMQALSLLLVCCRMLEDMDFQPRLSTERQEALEDLLAFSKSLPASFTTHPVMWAIAADEEDSSNHRALLDALPFDAHKAAYKEYTKFKEDFRVIQHIITHHKALLPWFIASAPNSHIPSAKQYAHAWLSINSRSVFFNMGLHPHAENFTLAPILDMANHTSDLQRVCQVLPTNMAGQAIISRGLGGAPSIAAGLEMRAPPERGLEAGEEVMIQYGARDDGTLLAEYGFHLSGNCAFDEAGDKQWQGNPYACLRMDQWILKYLETTVNSETVQVVQDTLQQHHMWLDWTVHPESASARPSWTTECGLRLIVALQNGDAASPIRKWKLMVEGKLTALSEENDKEAAQLLASLCQAARDDFRHKLQALQRNQNPGCGGKDGWKESHALVMSLLQSQIAIAERMMADCAR